VDKNNTQLNQMDFAALVSEAVLLEKQKKNKRKKKRKNVRSNNPSWRGPFGFGWGYNIGDYTGEGGEGESGGSES